MRLVHSSIIPLLLGLLLLVGLSACGIEGPPPPTETSPDGEGPDDPAPPPPPIAGGTQRVSVATGGALADGDSAGIALSHDGRFVAFASSATNLVAGDTNAAWDVFVHDRSTGTTERVSIGSEGEQGDADSVHPAISADGRFVAFTSAAGTLAPGAATATEDVFVRDRVGGVTELVSVAADGGPADGRSWAPTISRDGRYVFFRSEATDLVTGHAAGGIFVRDRQAATTTHLGLDGQVVVSGDGRRVARLLEPPDHPDGPRVVVHDLASGQEHALHLTPGGEPPDNDVWLSAFNADGTVLGFHSLASNLVAGIDQGWDVGWDSFVHDRTAGATELVSVATTGLPGGNFSFQAIPDAEGRHVLFTSLADDLLAQHDHVGWSLFVRDRELGHTERVPVSTGPTSLYEFGFTLSGDGRHVAFTYRASFDAEGYQAGVEDIAAHPQDVVEVFVHSFGGP